MWVLKNKKSHHGKFDRVLPYALGFGIGLLVVFAMKL